MLGYLCVLILFVEVSARKLSDEEYYQLPQLFHLDDYQKCFSRGQGLYCLGTFYVTPIGEPNALFDLMKDYTSEPHTFNRTLIHRGYCVSSRCPDINTTRALHFEHCTARVANDLFLQPHLTSLLYCHTEVQTQDDGLDVAKLIYLLVICALILLNVIGTVYDVRMKSKDKKNEMLVAWSVRKNWNELTSYNKRGLELPLAALHGIRVGVTIGACLTHSAVLYFMMYVHNPRALEQMVSHPLTMMVQNSTAIEQMLFVLSGYLHARQLRQRVDKHPITLGTVALVIAKRIFRLFPVFILVVGFAATWWPAMGSGPLWAATVGAESSICREKFWTHLLFINNLVEPDRLCIVSTWFMAADLQLQIISTIVMVALIRLSFARLPVLVILFIGSCLLNAGLAYIFDWTPMLYLTSSPEKIRTIFRGELSFAGLYVSPWGNLPACILGVIWGYFSYGMKRRDWNLRTLKWMHTLSNIISVPLLLGWILMGYFLQHVKSKAFVVAYVALERFVFQVFCLGSYVAFSIFRGFLIKLLAWRGWHVLSRMSYPVMLVHWLVNMYLVASTPQPLSTSAMDIGIHGYITAFYTFLLAVPITVSIEMPMKKVFDIITSRQSCCSERFGNGRNLQMIAVNKNGL